MRKRRVLTVVSRNCVRADGPGGDETAVARRGNRLPAMECLAVAKAWVYQSSRGPIQRKESMWDIIAAHCQTLYGVVCGPEAICSTWKRVSRACQKYLAARESVIKIPPSGRTIEGSGDQFMELYCARAGSKDRTGQLRDAPAFQHTETSLCLMT